MLKPDQLENEDALLPLLVKLLEELKAKCLMVAITKKQLIIENQLNL